MIKTFPREKKSKNWISAIREKQMPVETSADNCSEKYRKFKFPIYCTGHFKMRFYVCIT